jgi:alpha-D-xyloside xylohydrolase
MSTFRIEGNKLIREYDGERLMIEAWGRDSLRVRATKNATFAAEDWALLEPEALKAEIAIGEAGATIANGKIVARVSPSGRIEFADRRGKTLLKECWRTLQDKPSMSLNRSGREFKPSSGDNYRIALRFLAVDGEKIFGMGQYQMLYLDMKGCSLELAQRNSQASVPFALSNLGYGMLWNNPAIGRAVFGKNETEWTAESSKQADYWVTAGDSPAEIEEAYARATGTVPSMPEYGTGFWQCKLRYRTQDELLKVAREHKRRGLPMSVIVCDFFHWPKQGEWKFDPEFWPDPVAMVEELKAMGIELMVSIWPTVDHRSENFEEMLAKGYLVRTERGVRITMQFLGQQVFYDPTNPGARDFVWGKAKRNYYDKGIKIFWLDEAEPEYTSYDYEHYRYYLGSDLEVGNIYPFMYAKTFYDGMKAAGQKDVLNLLRCAWAGSQRFGALVWSGDIDSTFECFRRQVRAGLSMGIAGIPWWTCDIGGFHDGNIGDPSFRELLIRWFEYGAFCPVFRLHGFRQPIDADLRALFNGSATTFGTGADNEVWSYGEDNYRIMRKYLLLRERIRPYIALQMARAHEKGTPVMRPLFYDFPSDEASWEVDDEYMFGPDLLVAPVLHEKKSSRSVYLPAGARWTDAWTGASHAGGITLEAAAPLDRIPLFLKNDARLPIAE